MCILVQSVDGLHLGGQEEHRQGNIRLMVHSERAGEVRDGERGDRSKFKCVGHAKKKLTLTD